MKKLSTILAAGTIALTMSTPVLAGSVGIPRRYSTTQPDAETIAELLQASKTAQREPREGNKDNNAFARRSYEIDSASGTHEQWTADLSESGGRSASTGFDLVTSAT